MGVLSYGFGNVMSQSFFPSGILLAIANILDAIRTLSYVLQAHFKYRRPTAVSPYPTYLKG